MRDKARCIHCGYIPKDSEPKIIPIAQGMIYVFDSMQEVGDVFNEPTKALIYSCFANPTVMAIEQKIADLGGDIGAVCISSGRAATLLAVLSLYEVGDNFISTSQIYGGTVNPFAIALKNYGVECVFVGTGADEETISTVIQENTRLIFGETTANPALSVPDIEKLAQIAHSHKTPLITSNTSVTPVLCEPFEFGADIVVHSTSKYVDGHTVQVGGVIVGPGNFDWTNGKFPEFTEPDESYHGITYVGNYGEAVYTIKAKVQLVRDCGACPAVDSVFLLNLGLETLAVRMERYCKDALGMANCLATSDKVKKVIYPRLENDKYYLFAKRYLEGTSGVISFIIEDGRDNAIRFMDGLKLASIEIYVADIRTYVLHPAGATHCQLIEEQLYVAGINPDAIRLSVELKSVEDTTEDIERNLSKVQALLYHTPVADCCRRNRVREAFQHFFSKR